ncbi:hypothetical protein ACQP2E_32660 [Actinoplanes sp. CA-015351]|uniref:hypothetical protein n=1 Tax=Actinoplanes sp. CA-015351 TaxID=3239897 RepID=UPI003D98852A
MTPSRFQADNDGESPATTAKDWQRLTEPTAALPIAKVASIADRSRSEGSASASER